MSMFVRETLDMAMLDSYPTTGQRGGFLNFRQTE